MIPTALASSSPSSLSATPILLVGVDFGREGGRASGFDASLTELSLLAQTAGFEPVAKMVCKRKAQDAALFIGSGKADEIRQCLAQSGAQEVLFDQALSPGQQRNLERHLGCPVNDRTLLILEIFAKRARSFEGKLQVELARLQYLSTRLVRRWSHLERQRGGIGNRGGPGETQIELDRRMILQAITRTKAQLQRVKKQRHTQRKARQRTGARAVSLVGYTNAGKSSLFNALTKARSYAADQLFATLDTTTRSLYLGQAASPVDSGRPPHHSVTLSDTVGFIRDLPHGLVQAFEATLQEACSADLLLHVVDASCSDYLEQMVQVQRVLHEIGAEGIEQWLVFNKLDALAHELRPPQLEGQFQWSGRTQRCFSLSAHTGEGLALLRQALLAWAKLESAASIS